MVVRGPGHEHRRPSGDGLILSSQVMELTLKWLTGHLGPRPTFPRSGESPEEFGLRRLAWRQAFRLFTARHRAERRMLRSSTVRSRPAVALSPEAAAGEAHAATPAGRPELTYGSHPLRLDPLLARPLPIAQRVVNARSVERLCARRSRPVRRRRTPPS